MPVPMTIEVKKSARLLHIVFDDGKEVSVGFDRLRAVSPSAGDKLKEPPQGIMIESIEQIGNYAIKPIFSDGHQTGIYGWDLLYNLADAE